MHTTRESIFVSAVRLFCTSFAAVLGIIVAILLIVMGLMFVSGQNVLPEKCSMTIAADADGNRNILPEHAPAILRINIVGVIGELDLTYDKLNNILLDSHQDLLHGNRVKGVLLYINSPGGTANDSAAIYRALMDYKLKYHVPIYAFVDGMCASGGYYIACAADKIYSTEDSVIGSIGVLMGPAFNFSQTMDKIGVQAMTLTEGKDKDMLNPFRPWKPDEDRSLQPVMATLYDQFTNTVLKARPDMTRQALVDEYGARVFISNTAQDMGFIDEGMGSYSSALTGLTRAAGIKEDEAYQVVQLKAPTEFFSSLLHNQFPLFSGKITHAFQVGPISSDLSGKFLYLYSP